MVLMYLLKNDRLYQFLAALIFLLAVTLVLVVPDRFKEPDDWAYRYAVENLSHGNLTVDNVVHQQQVQEANQQGGQLGQYVQIGQNAWAFEKSPGYVYFLIPFYLLGVPQLANFVLAGGLAFVTYRLLKRLKDARLAFIGVVMVLFTPVALAMMQREYMDGFASAAFLGIGGGIYIDYCLKAESFRPRTAFIALFLSGLFLASAIAIRYTNATVVTVFGIHFLITRISALRKGQFSRVWREALPLVVGALITIALLLWYQNAVFGSPLAYGYQYTKGDVSFAYEYLGTPRFWEIISTNITQLFRPLLTGFPLLVLAVPALIAGIIQVVKNVCGKRRSNTTQKWLQDLNGNIFWLLVGWLIAVFGLYMMYEWTANQGGDRPFITVTRFYLPALLPLVILAALLSEKLSNRLLMVIMVVLILVGGALFIQSSTETLKGGALPPNRPINLLPTEWAKLIEQTRLEVKISPTSPSNFQNRLDILTHWIGELKQQGLQVGQAVFPTEISRIQNLMTQGNVMEACRGIDAGYSKLEQLVRVS
jgi:hypothetical protein